MLDCGRQLQLHRYLTKDTKPEWLGAFVDNMIANLRDGIAENVTAREEELEAQVREAKQRLEQFRESIGAEGGGEPREEEAP